MAIGFALGAAGGSFVCYRSARHRLMLCFAMMVLLGLIGVAFVVVLRGLPG